MPTATPTPAPTQTQATPTPAPAKPSGEGKWDSKAAAEKIAAMMKGTPSPAPPAPATAPPAPAPSPEPPKPTPAATAPPASKDAPLIPDFQPTAPPAPAASTEAPTTVTQPEPDIPEPDVDPQSPIAKNFKALRESKAKWEREAQEATAKLVALQQKQSAPAVPPDYEELKTKYAEANRKLQQVELDGHPLFQGAFDSKIQVHIDLAKEVAGDKADAIENIMKSPPGKYRDQRLAEIADEMEPSQQNTVNAAYYQQKLLERERKTELENAPQTLQKIKEREAEFKAQQETRDRQTRLTFAEQELALAGQMWEEFRPKVGDDNHNQQLAATQQQVTKWMDQGLTPRGFAKVAVWAAKGIRSVNTEQALRTQIQTLEAQVAALSSAQPDPSGGGSAPAPAPKWSPAEGDKAYQRALGRH